MAGAEGVRVWRAPGRVNLIGEHTDYNEGFVLPCAIALECRIEARDGANGELAVASVEMREEVRFSLSDLAAATPQKRWTDYVVGVAREVAAAGYELKPMRLSIVGTVPLGSGLSSSAALEVATALALLDGQAIDRMELAKLCQRAERNFVGMPCGIMDQYASVFGEEHAAILIDCRSLTHETVHLPDGVEVIAVNTMVKHELGQSAYRQRVAECKEALSHFPGKASLREVTEEELERHAGAIAPVVRARARHVVGEDARVGRFRDAAAGGDLRKMGQLFVESHRSLQHDYEVSCEELDYLVDTALTLDGVIGARMTGGGFGGCTVNLVESGRETAFEEAITGKYRERFGRAPAVYHCRPARGAGAA